MIYSKINTEFVYTLFNGVWKRKLHIRILKSVFIDLTICFLLAILFFDNVEVDLSLERVVVTHNYLLLMLLYFSLSMAIFSRTLGQFIMKIKVISNNGENLSFIYRLLRGVLFPIEILLPTSFTVFLVNADAVFMTDYLTKSFYKITYEWVKYKENVDYSKPSSSSLVLEKQVDISTSRVCYKWYLILPFIIYLFFSNTLSLYRLFVFNNSMLLSYALGISIFIASIVWQLVLGYLFVKNIISKDNYYYKIELYSDFIRVYMNEFDFEDYCYSSFYYVYGESGFGNAGKIILSRKHHASDMSSPILLATLFELFQNNKDRDYIIIDGVLDYKSVYKLLKERIEQQDIKQKENIVLSVKQDMYNTIIHSITFFQLASYFVYSVIYSVITTLK